MVLFLRVWHPGEPLLVEGDGRGQPAIAGAAEHDAAHEAAVRRREGHGQDSRGDIFQAYAPYLIIIVVFGLAQWGPLKDFLAKGAAEFTWPGTGDITTAEGEAPSATTFKFGWLGAAGTLLLLQRLHHDGRAEGQTGGGAARVRLDAQPAQVGDRDRDGRARAGLRDEPVRPDAVDRQLAGGRGGILAFLSPIIGWIGVAVTGSDTSSNSLFGVLQVTAAKEAGLDPTLLAAANSSGGVLGKMISPQNLAIGVAAVGLDGEEGELFRRVVGWSLALLLIMCVLVYLQSTAVLSWMVV